MLRMIVSSLLVLALLCALLSGTATAFAPSPILVASVRRTTSATSSSTTTTAVFFFGTPKDDGSPGDYVCMDCGYVFTKGPAAWAALPADYSCPPCGSIKRRFKKVPKGSVSSTNQKPAKKGW